MAKEKISIEIETAKELMKDVAESAVKTALETVQNQKLERKYIETQTIIHDLYELSDEKMKKNIGWFEAPDIVSVTHQHHFHTVDSNGVKQFRTTTVGGHFHEVKVIPQEDGVPLLELSGPKRQISKKVGGVVKVFVEDLPEFLEDNHKHQTKYIKSEKIQLRQTNPKAVEIQTYWNNKTAPNKDFI